MTPRTITYEVRDDGPGPDVGDVLYSTRSAYLVVSSRAISTRNGTRKFALGVLRYGADFDGAPRARRFTLRWDSRSPKRGSAGFRFERSARAR